MAMRIQESAAIDRHEAESLKSSYASFIDLCRVGPTDFRLTPRAEPTAYARCFAVFGMHLIGARKALDEARDELVPALRADIRLARAAVARPAPRDKSYRQLLCFTLSALATLEAIDEDPLVDLVAEQVPEDIGSELMALGSLSGRAQSGNQAMFLAIFLLHLRRYSNARTQAREREWLKLHLEAMNRFGFWGPDTGPTHLHVQNGYHQYEIFELLGTDNPREADAVAAAASLVDPQGHFAPYPGGGGCFDYDAVFVLTPGGRVPGRDDIRALLAQTRNTISAEQRPDGGFCESLRVRPRLPNLPGFAERLGNARNFALLGERARYALTLQRSKHNRIHTHWSCYSRRWDEANLWDSWFRTLTIARIEIAFEPGAAVRWAFIDYPGIGWHPALRGRSIWT
jgi:hypothetical protein